MEISWLITQDDVNSVKKFIEQNQNPFVASRLRRNINKENLEISEDSILRSMVMCILTSQQRSGPNTPVGLFLQREPFPLTFQALRNTKDPEEFFSATLKKNGLNRYINKIPKFLVNNYKFLLTTNWHIINLIKAHLQHNSDKISERKLANYLNDNFQGFGPKQSRNFLQTLGITRFEIPIDSRITSWLNDFGFPVTLTSIALQDREYYEFVSDGIQNLCKESDILPCILDAAIFSSFDKGQWTEENVIY
jgi:thermostable 8-oxoguanine DNA glycosylase